MINKRKTSLSSGQRRVQTPPISFRLPPEDDAYYREQAKLSKMSLSAFIAKKLMAGVLSETAENFEERMRVLVAEMHKPVSSSDHGFDRATQLSLFTCEALLTAIVQAQNPKTVLAAQAAAKARLLSVRGSAA